MIILARFVIACVASPVADSFCLWATPITITNAELDCSQKVTDDEVNYCMSEETLRQIDNYDQTYVKKCINNG